MANSSEKSNDHSFLELRDLKEFRICSKCPGQVFFISIMNISVSFCVHLYIIRDSGRLGQFFLDSCFKTKLETEE